MREVKKGELYRHFKGNIYEVVAIAKDTEDLSLKVVYKHNNEYWVRPYDMFISEVDHKKYPEVKQKYRFEKIKEEK